MPYALRDVDVDRPLPEISLAPDESGLGLLVRKDGRPLDFVLRPLGGGTALNPADLAQLIAEESAAALVRHAIREELAEPAPARPVSVTIAVCTRERVRDLETCLQSILDMLEQPEAAAHDVDVLVVDNAPATGETKELIDSLPSVRYAREPRPGLDFARNRALSEARGAFVAYIDDDATVDPQWLAGLAEALTENPEAAVVTGLVLPSELATRAQIVFEHRGGFRRGFEKVRYEGEHRPGNPVYPCGAGIFGAGANMVVRKDAVLGLGGFDEALDTGPPLPGGGDLDIFYRVIRAGFPLVYEPRMLAFHRHRREYGALRRQYWTWGTGFMAFVAKTYRTDPEQRPKLRRLIRWWFEYQSRELVRSVVRRHPLTPDLVLAELAGGVVGLAGTYERSRRRIRRLRDRFA
jgi:glycosyltransferase involved in cell wall biosynthesis